MGEVFFSIGVVTKKSYPVQMTHYLSQTIMELLHSLHHGKSNPTHHYFTSNVLSKTPHKSVPAAQRKIQHFNILFTKEWQITVNITGVIMQKDRNAFYVLNALHTINIALLKTTAM